MMCADKRQQVQALRFEHQRIGNSKSFLEGRDTIHNWIEAPKKINKGLPNSAVPRNRANKRQNLCAHISDFRVRRET